MKAKQPIEVSEISLEVEKIQAVSFVGRTDEQEQW
jgi:hypothetical protein